MCKEQRQILGLATKSDGKVNPNSKKTQTQSIILFLHIYKA
jgi:hypothetical protein